MNIEISEAAVEAAFAAYIDHDDTMETSIRAALEAALPHLHPQPAELAEQQGEVVQNSVDRLIEAIEGECGGLVIATETTAAILGHVYSDDRWREAVLSEWALTFIDPKSEEPSEILRAVINWNVRTALDPAVSSDAAALAATGKQQVGGVQGDARAQFEAWANGRDLSTNPPGAYVSCYVQNDWEVWQAALAVRQPGVK